MDAYLIVLISIGVVVSGNSPTVSPGQVLETCLRERNVTLNHQMREFMVEFGPRIAAFKAGNEPTGYPLFYGHEFPRACENGKGYVQCYNQTYAGDRSEYVNSNKLLYTMLKDAVCDESIQKGMLCFTDSEEHPREECNTQCRSATDSFRAALDTRARTAEVADNRLKTGCAHYSCRVRCDKANILRRCGQAGLDGIKKTLQAARDYLKAVNKANNKFESVACPDDELLAGL